MQLAEALRRLTLRRAASQYAAIADDYRFLYVGASCAHHKRAYLRWMTVALIQHERDVHATSSLCAD